MKLKVMTITVLLLISLWAVATPGKDDRPSSDASKTSSAPHPASAVHSGGYADEVRVEGEKRFRANCGRCHAAPQKFPPRMMATIVRHMRVRATITDEDMKFILSYMTQ